MGVVVLPSIMTTSDYKTNIWSEDQLWKKLHKLDTYHQPDQAKPKESILSQVKEWLKSCHLGDEEVRTFNNAFASR